MKAHSPFLFVSLLQPYVAILWACQEATFPMRTSQLRVSGQNPQLPNTGGEDSYIDKSLNDGADGHSALTQDAGGREGAGESS